MSPKTLPVTPDPTVTSRLVMRITRLSQGWRAYMLEVIEHAGPGPRCEGEGVAIYRAGAENRDAAERAGLDFIRLERPEAVRFQGPAGPLNLWEVRNA